jgi:hypothetical protein
VAAEPQAVPDPLLIHVLGLDLGAFWIGVIGSLAVELVALLAVYEADDRFPDKYRHIGFYVTGILVALMGGVLVEIYRVNNLPAALQIGASTPVMLAALATVRRPPGQNPPPNPINPPPLNPTHPPNPA